MDTADSAELVRLYLDGRLNNEFLRGRTSLPHAVQAAQYFARQASGDDRIASLSPLKVDRSDHEIRVVLDSEAGPTEVCVREGWSEPLLSQCHAKVPGRVRTYTLTSISAP